MKHRRLSASVRACAGLFDAVARKLARAESVAKKGCQGNEKDHNQCFYKEKPVMLLFFLFAYMYFNAFRLCILRCASNGLRIELF